MVAQHTAVRLAVDLTKAMSGRVGYTNVRFHHLPDRLQADLLGALEDAITKQNVEGLAPFSVWWHPDRISELAGGAGLMGYGARLPMAIAAIREHLPKRG